MRRETRTQLFALACMLGFLAASGGLATQIAASVGKNKLVFADKAETGDPPQVSLGIAMGAFRGLFVNYLWIRANDLKEEGKYYEAVDLGGTITKLQPRFPKVWSFHAWNLAYNISVSTNTPQERWNWVQAGIRLLRNEGVVACPNDIGIQKELAWIHLHKVQGYMDDAHQYYKRKFALEWSYVMGSPPQLKLEDMGTGKLKGMYVKRWLGPIVDAPDSLAELLGPAPRPGETSEDAQQRALQTAALVDALKKECGHDLDLEFLRHFEDVDARQRGSMGTGITPPTLRDDPLARLINSPRFKPEIGRAVIAFTRKKVLVHDYHMQPELMSRYTEEFGPLDWRHPAAHAVYWSHRGVEETLRRVDEKTLKDFDVLNTDRLTIQAVQELFRTGDVTFDVLNPQFYLTLPSTEFIDSYRQAIQAMAARSKYEKDNSRPYRFFFAGYENFMTDAVRYLYRRGDKDAAAAYLKSLITDPQLNTVGAEAKVRQWSMPIDEWIIDQIVGDQREESPTVALQEISGSLAAAYVGGLLRGDQKQFIDAFNYARLFHEQYQRSRSFKVWVASQSAPDQGSRMGLPVFPKYASEIFAQLIQAAGLPNGSIMYRRAPPDLQCNTYAYLERFAIKGMIDEGEKSSGMPGFDIWFPPPKGVEACRVEMFGAGAEAPKGRSEMK